MTSFSDKVYKLTRLIPKGKVATYGQLAELAGSPGAARAVGMCMKTNHDAPHTPCHRVVASNGKLTGYSAGEGAQGAKTSKTSAGERARLRAKRDRGGLELKKQMLLDEGVKFTGDRVNLVISKWNPSKHVLPTKN